MTDKIDKNETLKKAQGSDAPAQARESSQDLTPFGKNADLELTDVGKVYGVKETLDYVRGLDMENDSNSGFNLEHGEELTEDQKNELKKEIGYQPHCDCEFGDIDTKEKLPSEKKPK